MSTTLTVNYREIFAEETVKRIDELLEENYYLPDMLEFIDQHSEMNFVHYEEYVTQGESIGYDAVDEFVEYWGMENIESASDVYRGSYNSPEEFAEEWTQEMNGEVPSYVVVDWKATWYQHLRHDFIFLDGYVFDRNW